MQLTRIGQEHGFLGGYVGAVDREVGVAEVDGANEVVLHGAGHVIELVLGYERCIGEEAHRKLVLGSYLLAVTI